jgi:hypothetical protein
MSNENEFVLNGVAYVTAALIGEQSNGLGCLGCEFDSNGCVAANHPCARISRSDRRDIIWVRKLKHG